MSFCVLQTCRDFTEESRESGVILRRILVVSGVIFKVAALPLEEPDDCVLFRL